MITMYLKLKMDRPAQGYYIVPGGYEFVFDDKTHIAFDFYTSSGSILKKDPTVIEFQCDDLDTDAFSTPECLNLSEDDKFQPAEKLKEYLTTHKITDICECYIYTGEYTDPEINVQSIEGIMFVLDDNVVEVSKDILQRYNATILSEK